MNEHHGRPREERHATAVLPPRPEQAVHTWPRADLTRGNPHDLGLDAQLDAGLTGRATSAGAAATEGV